MVGLGEEGVWFTQADEASVWLPVVRDGLECERGVGDDGDVGREGWRWGVKAGRHGVPSRGNKMEELEDGGDEGKEGVGDGRDELRATRPDLASG